MFLTVMFIRTLSLLLKLGVGYITYMVTAVYFGMPEWAVITLVATAVVNTSLKYKLEYHF